MKCTKNRNRGNESIHPLTVRALGHNSLVQLCRFGQASNVLRHHTDVVRCSLLQVHDLCRGHRSTHTIHVSPGGLPSLTFLDDVVGDGGSAIISAVFPGDEDRVAMQLCDLKVFWW